MLTQSLMSYTRAQDYTNLDIGEISRNYQIDDDETKYFKVFIDPKKYDKSQDLIIKVFSEG